MINISIYTQVILDHDNNFDHTTLWGKCKHLWNQKQKCEREKSHPDEVGDQNIISGGGSYYQYYQ